MYNLKETKELLCYAADELILNKETLGRLDAEIGDGDHGLAMSRVGSAIKDACAAVDDECSFAELFDAVAETIRGRVSGFSGIIWCAFMKGIVSVMRDNPGRSLTLAEMMIGGYDNVEILVDAREGDKTFMDALLPAVEFVRTQEGSDLYLLRQMALTAYIGSEKTIRYQAKYGRARVYKEKSIGVKDAGAASVAIFLQGLAARAMEINDAAS